jgi:DNA replication and repair protein RecF
MLAKAAAPLENQEFLSPSAVGLSRLVLENFRNYRCLDLSFAQDPVVLVGANGAGKTNILEAISFLSPGRGLRGIKLSQATMIQSGQNQGWKVAAILQDLQGDVTLGTGLEMVDIGRERRIVKINGELARSQSALTDYIGMTWLTPQMDHFFLEPASIRRKFLDRLIFAFDPSHSERVYRYEYTLRERSLLLREGNYDVLWVKTLEEKLANDGVAIAAARVQMVNQLSSVRPCENVQLFPAFEMVVSGDIEGWLETMPAVAVEDRFASVLADSRAVDAVAGGASIGPHRSDLKVKHLDNELAAEVCSTGEQKMLLLAIVLTFARLCSLLQSRTTILLLDDVASHLDQHHRMVLFQEICDLGLQVWLTGTDVSIFRELSGRAQFFTINHATLTRGPY